jgi:hypothetical protein
MGVTINQRKIKAAKRNSNFSKLRIFMYSEIIPTDIPQNNDIFEELR